MKVAFYQSAQDAIPRVEDLTWQQVGELLGNFREGDCVSAPCVDHKCPSKNGPAWAPHDVAERRRNDNVRAVTLAVFDLDHQKEADLESSLGALLASGQAFIVHSTHSHLPPEDCSLRLVMPLSRPVTPAEWPQVRRAAAERLGLRPDEAAKDPARLYFLPTRQREGAHEFHHQDGAPLDVDALLALPAPAPAPKTSPEPAQAAPEGAPVNVGELGELLRRHCKPENRALVGRVLRGEAFAPLGQQDTTLQTLMSTAAFCLPNETPDDAVLHLFAPSFAATEWLDGYEHLCGEALKKLHRARERKAARDEERARENAQIRERLGLKARPSEPTPMDEGAAEDPDAWADRLVTYATKDGDRLRICEANVALVLQHADEWRGVLRFNELSKGLECVKGPCDGAEADVLDVEVAMWFQRSDWGRLGLMPKPGMVRDCLRVVGLTNRYNPVREYLDALKWDGKPRCDDFLLAYFDATNDPRYLRAVGSKWLISAVARALKPGCKVDTTLILEGLQGMGKSTAFRALGGEWFSDAPIDIGNKDSWALVSQFWILEFAEMKDVRRSDVETLKGFLSRQEDTFRPPYGKSNIRFARCAVFAGTANGKDYLKYDPTGYRRIWPVECQTVRLADLKRDRDQLWAEAVARFRAGEQWWLTDEEAELAQVVTVERAENPVEGKQEVVLRWLLGKTPEQRPTELHVSDVARDALGYTPAQMNASADREIGLVLRALGCTSRVQQASGVRRRVWVVPEGLRIAPQVAAGAKIPTLAAVPTPAQSA